ncbi:PorV/PorQ family protein [candidate division KSB1 bacterium]|nr:PorV/PorQ family protein [candidate division KSB1 bacterium]
MKSVHYIFVIITLFIYQHVGFAQSKVGTTAAPFLGISVAPRATAMGGAFAAVANDVSTIYYNPGGLSRIQGTEFMFCPTEWIMGTNFNWFGIGINLDGTNALGISLTQLDYGEEEITTVENPEGTGAFWSASEVAAAITYTRNLTDRFSIGGTGKYISTRYFNESGSAFALDLGLLFTTDFHDMKLGMSISNFGTDIQLGGKDLLHRVDLDPDHIGNNETIVANLKTDSWPLPLFFRVGLAMDVMKTSMSRLTLAVDAFRPSDNTEIINAGGEFSINDWIFLRGGYKSLFRDDSEEGLTLGAGLNYNSSTAGRWSLDYSFVDFGVLDSIQMFSFKLGF